MAKTADDWRGNARRTMTGSAMAMAALLVACQTPAPPIVAQPPPKPQLSYLNIPISMPLTLAAEAADKDVPRYAGVDSFLHPIQGGAQAPECGIDAGYSITRGPLSMSAAGNAIHTTFDLSYWLQGRKQLPCPGTFRIASCGLDPEPARIAKVSIDTTIAILPDLSTSVHSTLGSVVPVDRCVLNPVGIDVTDGLMTAFGRAMQPILANLDKRLAAQLQLQQRIETGWARMNEPAELRPGIWLALNPEGLGVMPLTIADDELRTGIQVRLRPVVSAGTKPESGATALPAADTAGESDLFEMQIPVEVEQAFVQSRLEGALDLKNGGTTVSLGKYSVHVTSADAYGQGTQVVVKLDFEGDVKGTAFLHGTPVYDAQTRTLSFPDLDYTLETDRTLLNSANWIAQGQIRDRLRTRFTIDMTKPVDQMKQGLEATLNRRRGNMQLHGEVQELKLVGIYRLANGSVFTAYLAAKGKVSAEIETQ